jgi:hypothetical protein
MANIYIEPKTTIMAALVLRKHGRRPEALALVRFHKTYIGKKGVPASAKENEFSKALWLALNDGEATRKRMAEWCGAHYPDVPASPDGMDRAKFHHMHVYTNSRCGK